MRLYGCTAVRLYGYDGRPPARMPDAGCRMPDAGCRMRKSQLHFVKGFMGESDIRYLESGMGGSGIRYLVSGIRAAGRALRIKN